MFFNFFQIVFLIPIILIGGFCVFTDLKHRKIYNKVILAGFIYGLLAFIYFSLKEFNGEYLISALINFTFAGIVSYALWFNHYWSAGDAKLFSLFIFLLPLDFYMNSNFMFFPGFNILINLFIPVILVLLFCAFFNLIKKIIKEKRININYENFSIFVTNFIKVFFVYVALFLLIQKVFDIFGEYIMNSDLFYFISICCIFFFYNFIYGFVKKHTLLNYLIIFLIIIYSFYLVVVGNEILLEQAFLRAFIFLGVIGLLKVFINSYINEYENKEIKIGDLKNGMTIFEEDREKYNKILNGKEIEKLNKEEVEKLKKSYREKELVRVYKDFSFAPYILISIIITIILKGSLLSLFV